MIYFTENTINCVCDSIRTMFRVFGMYNFAFLPKYERKFVRISALYTKEILTVFRSHFGRNDDFINSF